MRKLLFALGLAALVFVLADSAGLSPAGVPAEEYDCPAHCRHAANQSFSYVRGYRDGWSGIWFSPVHGALSAQYRQGWSKGMDDHKHGRPYNP